jgi:hypothetical protein
MDRDRNTSMDFSRVLVSEDRWSLMRGDTTANRNSECIRERIISNIQRYASTTIVKKIAIYF